MTSPGAIPSPLAYLEIHIFSIHANSASCEQLFSLFRNIQTKQKNQMASKTLQTIAKAKMHLHNSHAASWNQKQQSRVKQHFGTPAQEFLLPAIPNSTLSSMLSPGIPERDINGENDLYLHSIGLRGVIKDFNLLAADNTDLDTNTPTYTWTTRSICNLPDTTSDHWMKCCKRCSKSLNKERAFYELLSNHDIDAVGMGEYELCDNQ